MALRRCFVAILFQNCIAHFRSWFCFCSSNPWLQHIHIHIHTCTHASALSVPSSAIGKCTHCCEHTLSEVVSVCQHTWQEQRGVSLLSHSITRSLAPLSSFTPTLSHPEAESHPQQFYSARDDMISSCTDISLSPSSPPPLPLSFFVFVIQLHVSIFPAFRFNLLLLSCLNYFVCTVISSSYHRKQEPRHNPFVFLCGSSRNIYHGWCGLASISNLQYRRITYVMPNGFCFVSLCLITVIILPSYYPEWASYCVAGVIWFALCSFSTLQVWLNANHCLCISVLLQCFSSVHLTAGSSCQHRNRNRNKDFQCLFSNQCCSSDRAVHDYNCQPLQR